MAYLTKEKQKQYEDIIRAYTEWSNPLILENTIKVINEGMKDELVTPAVLTKVKHDVIGSIMYTFGSKNVSKELDKMYNELKRLDPEIKRALENSPNQVTYAQYTSYGAILSLSFNASRNASIFGVLYRSVLSVYANLLYLFVSIAVVGTAVAGANIGIIINLLNKCKSLLNLIFKFENKAKKKQKTVNEFVDVSTLSIGVVFAILTQIVPAIRELIYQFYYLRIKSSDSINSLSDALEYNALELKKKNTHDEKEAEKIAKRQNTIASNLKKIANKLDFYESATKKAQAQAKKDSEKDKMKIKELEKYNDLYKEELSSFSI